ncbi:hypothetical protein ENUP19_0256G0002 [Entamoeba nuttalli]|uniref:Uncharacterized protein n=1 Tax=Entamoeba nuttalli TaxID=412467 RepID=A0ABQ0DRT3_9EUKA
MERYMIDGNKFILNVPSKSAVEDMKIELNDRNIDETYILKMRTSVQIFREVNNKYPTFPILSWNA